MSGDHAHVHVSIDVPDLEAGIAFYCGVFGWTERTRPLPAMAVLDAGNVTVCIHGKPSGTAPTASEGPVRAYERHWTPVHLDVHVGDFAKVLARARAHGAQVEQEFLAGPHPAVAFCADPFGNGFCILEAR